jgi:hypothetical protein
VNVDLADRIAALRDEVLDTVERGEQGALNGEIFDATLRCLVAFEATDPGIDLALHDALSRRLAWGDSEHALLAEADEVCERLLASARRALREPSEEMLVVEAVTQIACTAARIVANAAIARAGTDRAAVLREQAALKRLREAVARQQEELARLGDPLAE